MSRVLRDLAESERRFQEQKNSIQRHMKGDAKLSMRFNSFIGLALLILPSLLIWVFSWVFSPTLEKEKMVGVAQIEKQVKSLSYPELSLTSMDLIESKEALEDATIGPETRFLLGEEGGDLDFDSLDLSSLPAELVKELQEGSFVPPEKELKSRDGLVGHIFKLIQYKDVLKERELPPMDFEVHMYSNEKHRRWVQINGVEHREGSFPNNRVELLRIEPQAVVIRFDNELVEIPALYEWEG